MEICGGIGNGHSGGGHHRGSWHTRRRRWRGPLWTSRPGRGCARCGQPRTAATPPGGRSKARRQPASSSASPLRGEVCPPLPADCVPTARLPEGSGWATCGFPASADCSSSAEHVRTSPAVWNFISSLLKRRWVGCFNRVHDVPRQHRQPCTMRSEQGAGRQPGTAAGKRGSPAPSLAHVLGRFQRMMFQSFASPKSSRGKRRGRLSSPALKQYRREGPASASPLPAPCSPAPTAGSAAATHGATRGHEACDLALQKHRFPDQMYPDVLFSP